MDQRVFVVFGLLIVFFPVIVAMAKFMPKILAFCVFVFRKHPEPGRKSIDSVAEKPTPYTTPEIKKLMQGNFAELGRDIHTKQTFLLDEDARSKNTVILGPTGAGKTSWLIATSLAGDIAYRKNSVIIFDPQDDFIRQVASLCKDLGRQLYIYPDIGFNPLNLVKKDAQDRAKVFNDVLAQVTQVSDEAQFYLQRQQLFVRQVIPLFESVYGKPMILRELWELCLRKDIRQLLLQDAKSNPYVPNYNYTVGAWSEAELNRNLSGLINFIDTICAGQNVHFYNQRYAPTIEDIIGKQEVCIIREGDDPGTEGHIRGLLYMIAIQEAAKMRSEDAHLVNLYIDEFHRYLNPAYPPFIATSRKRRFAQILAVQSLSQLTSKGRDYSNTIMTNARTCVVHTGIHPEDAEYIAESIGKRQFIYRTVGESTNKDQILKGRTVNENQGVDYLMYPHQVRNLDQNLSLILSVKERGLDAPRFVEKPKPIPIPKAEYKSPQVAPFSPPTVWDERSGTNSGQQSNLNPQLDKVIDEVLEKARDKNNANQKSNKPAQRPKPGQTPKKKGEI